MSYCKVIYSCICRQASAGSKPITAKDNNINLILTGKILQSIQLQVWCVEISNCKQSWERSVQHKCLTIQVFQSDVLDKGYHQYSNQRNSHWIIAFEVFVTPSFHHNHKQQYSCITKPLFKNLIRKCIQLKKVRRDVVNHLFTFLHFVIFLSLISGLQGKVGKYLNICITSKPIIPYSTSNSWIAYGFHKLIVKLEDPRLARVYKPSTKA